MDNISLNSIIYSITSNRILLVIVILLASILIYSILKRLMKIIVIVLIALILYLGYLNYTGKQAEGPLQVYIKQSEDGFKEIMKRKDKLNDIIDTADKLTK